MKSEESKKKFLALIALISFLSNLVWEILQPSLFKGYDGFWQHFGKCVFATIGDMVFITSLYIFFTFLFKDFFWIRNLSPGKAFLIIVTGALSAVVFEKIAVSLGMWEYGDMPLIPGVDVGLLPVLQFTILPMVSYYLAYELL